MGDAFVRELRAEAEDLRNEVYALRCGIRALADEGFAGTSAQVNGEWRGRLRALLDPSPAATTGEALTVGMVETIHEDGARPNVPSQLPAGEALVQQIAEAVREPVLNEQRPAERVDKTARAVLAWHEAQVAPLRDEVERLTADNAVGATNLTHYRDNVLPSMAEHVNTQMARADAAESALRQVREDMTALAHGWEQPLAGARQRYNGSDEFSAIIEEEAHRKKHAAEVRAILSRARVGAADTQPEGAGEAVFASPIFRYSEWLDSQGLIVSDVPDENGTAVDKRTHEDLAREFIAAEGREGR